MPGLIRRRIIGLFMIVHNAPHEAKQVRPTRRRYEENLKKLKKEISTKGSELNKMVTESGKEKK